MPEETKANEKSIRLLKYLQEIAKLRMKTVRDIKSYHRVLWLKDIPVDSSHCFSRAIGEREGYDDDIWVEIKKYDEPVLEEVPDDCEDWVDNSKLYDTSSYPELYESIFVREEEENTSWVEGDPEEEKVFVTNKELKIEDFPEISNKWKDYADSKWRPWAELHKKWSAVQGIYSQLFSMYQDQLKLGEEYELVMSLGYLSWKTKKGYQVNRHILVGSVTLNFEARQGKFVVVPSIDGAKLSVEFDMLETEEQPPYKNRKTISESLESLSDDLWNRSGIDPILQSSVNILGEGQGEYHSNDLNIFSGSSSEKPVLSYAPALILRKRNTKSLQQALESMMDQIKKGINIPVEFLDLSEGIERENNEYDEEDEYSEEKEKSHAKRRIVKYIFLCLQIGSKMK
jgi:hypothetical protein